MRDTLRTYYHLTKPGIIRGNLLTAAAGFGLAATQPGRQFDLWLGIAALAGLALVVASACVCNNYLDRDIDAKMARTRERALPTHKVSARTALTYAAVLGAIGMGMLVGFVNWLAAGLALAGFVAYVFVYGWAKRHTAYSTAIGTVSGSIPPVVGYAAVTNQLDAAAVILFVILTCWQMAHFYAIAVYRLTDYAAAKLPVWPAVYGIAQTRRQITIWSCLLVLAVPLLALYGYTGLTYAALTVGICVWWLVAGLRDKTTDDVLWAKRMFLRSLVVILMICVATALGAVLP